MNVKSPTENKVDELIETAAAVKAALDRRSFWIGLGIILPLIVGAILLWQVNDSAMAAERIARDAYIQSLRNNRQNLLYQRDFAQTRDCPVEYFRDLLEVSRARGDLTTVEPPCEPVNIDGLNEEIEAVDRVIEAQVKMKERD